MQPLCLEEAKKLSEENEGKEELGEYFKKFVKIKKKDVEPFKKDLKSIESHKMKEEYVIKIMDIMPEDSTDVNKIFVDVSLDENEIKQILDIVAKYR